MDTINQQENYNANKTYHEVVYSTDWETYHGSKYHEYRNKWTDNPKNQVIGTFPLHLDIETTNVCNLKCPMCARTILLSKKEFSDQGYMTRDEYKMIIDQGVANGLYSIKLNYLGEPLLHKDIAWQIQYAKDAGIVDVMLNTNGDLLSKEMSHKLLEAGLDKIFVSFDSISPDIYDVQRKGTSLGKVIDNLFYFCQLRNDKYPKTHIRLSMVMYETPEYRAQFEGLQTMWKNLVDAVGYGFYIEKDVDKMSDYPKVDGFYCEQLFQRMFIKYNGNVTVCCVDDKDRYPVGNWRQQSLKEIWESEAYQQIRTKHISGNYNQIPMCAQCYLPVAK